MNAQAEAGAKPVRQRKRREKRAPVDDLPVRIGGMDYVHTASTPSRMLGFDQSLIWVCVAMLAWGVVMVYSASIALSDSPRFAHYSPTFFAVRHAMWVFLACVAAVLAFQIRMDW